MDDMNPQQVRRFVEAFKQTLIQFRRKHYELGGYLLRVRDENIYTSWPRINEPHGERGYASWSEFCEPETGYSTRTCDQFIQNYQRARELELDEDGLPFARCMRLGWSKLAVVLRYVDGPNNRFRQGPDGHEDALEIALDAAERMPEPRLRAFLAARRREDAINNAREAAGDPSLQPEDVGDSSAPLSPTNPAGYVPYQLRFENNASLDTFTRAVDIIRNRYDQNLGVGRCVSMMALHYMATHARDDEGGAVIDAENMIRLFEDALGIRISIDAPRRTTKKKTSKKKATKKKRSKVARRRRQRSEASQ
jgi:hypothetical protein